MELIAVLPWCMRENEYHHYLALKLLKCLLYCASRLSLLQYPLTTLISFWWPREKHTFHDTLPNFSLRSVRHIHKAAVNTCFPCVYILLVFFKYFSGRVSGIGVVPWLLYIFFFNVSSIRMHHPHKLLPFQTNLNLPFQRIIWSFQVENKHYHKWYLFLQFFIFCARNLHNFLLSNCIEELDCIVMLSIIEYIYRQCLWAHKKV